MVEAKSYLPCVTIVAGAFAVAFVVALVEAGCVGVSTGASAVAILVVDVVVIVVHLDEFIWISAPPLVPVLALEPIFCETGSL